MSTLDYTPPGGDGAAARRVLFLCKQRTTEAGTMTSSGLLNSARMVAEALCRDVPGTATRLVDVVDGNSIDREVALYRPTDVVLEAYWCPPAKLAELARLHPTVYWLLRNHSKLPFLAGEGIAVAWSYEYIRTAGPRFTLSCNSPEAADSFGAIGLGGAYLPNLYPLDDCRPPDPVRTELDVGCFGAIRPLKNHLLQAVAAIRAANYLDLKLRFHVNVGRQEMGGESCLKSLRGLFGGHTVHSLVEHPWMPHPEFISTMQLCDIVLQVTYSETFNIVAADAVVHGVPTIGGPDIFWMPPALRRDPNDDRAIAELMQRLLLNPAHSPWPHLHTACLRNLEQHYQDGLAAWKAYLH